MNTRNLALAMSLAASTSLLLSGCGTEEPRFTDPNPTNPVPGGASGTTGGSTNNSGGSSPTVGTGSAKDCYASVNNVVGTKVEQVGRHTSANGSSATATSSFTVQGPGTFEGKSATRVSFTVKNDSGNAAGNSDTEGDNYAQYDDAAFRLTALGSEFTSQTGQGPIASKLVIEPGLLARYDLNPGESYTQTFKTTVSGSFNGFQIPPTSSDVDLKTTYLGQETITVPAGTFKTCKFEKMETISGGAASGSRLEWFGAGAAGSANIKAQGADGGIDELISLKINGTPITSN